MRMKHLPHSLPFTRSLALLATLAAVYAQADVKLPVIFSDRMVFVRAVHEAKHLKEHELEIYNSWFG